MSREKGDEAKKSREKGDDDPPVMGPFSKFTRNASALINNGNLFRWRTLDIYVSEETELTMTLIHI